MKVWLDDERHPPTPEWVWCLWPEEVIEHLKTGKVYAISLDHDLGEDSSYAKPRTGMTVIKWLEKEVFNHRFHAVPRRIYVHTQNNVEMPIMKEVARRILESLKRHERRQDPGRHPGRP